MKRRLRLWLLERLGGQEKPDTIIIRTHIDVTDIARRIAADCRHRGEQ